TAPCETLNAFARKPRLQACLAQPENFELLLYEPIGKLLKPRRSNRQIAEHDVTCRAVLTQPADIIYHAFKGALTVSLAGGAGHVAKRAPPPIARATTVKQQDRFRY